MANVKEMCDEMVQRIETANSEFVVLENLQDEMNDLGLKVDVEPNDPFNAFLDYEDYNVDLDFMDSYARDDAALSEFAETMRASFADLEKIIEDKITPLEDLRLEANYYRHNSESY